MPGTIQVSVLDFMDLQSSSISVKVSMGNREYQTWDKGDFYFPLTTLRDNLIVTLHDAEGNELSRTGVETMSIVEKGLWDDLFPLEGGGHLHMKLQFILSEEERKRVRELRESALKKKHWELLTSSLRHSETAAVATVGGNFASSSLYLNHEITDSQEHLAQMEAVSVEGGSVQGGLISNPISPDKDPQSGPGKRGGILLNRLEQGAPNDTDGSEGTSLMAPLSQELKFINITGENHKILEKTETQSPLTDVTTMPCEEKIETRSPLTDVTMRPCEEKIESQLPLTNVTTMPCEEKIETQLPLTDATARPCEEKIEIRSPPTDVTARPYEEKIENQSFLTDVTTSPCEEKIETRTLLTDVTARPREEKIEIQSPPADVTARPCEEMIEIQSPPTDVTARPISSQEALYPQLGCSESLVAKNNHSVSSLLEQDQSHSPKKQSALDKTSSNVKKMISAFESKLAQELRPHVDAPTIKSQSNNTKIGGSLKGPSVKEEKTEMTKTSQQIVETKLNSFSTGKPWEVNLQQSPKHIRRGDQIGFDAHSVCGASDKMPMSQNIVQLEVLGAGHTAVEGTNSREKDNYKVQQKKENRNEQGTFLEELAGPCTAETATVSRRMLDGPMCRDQSYGVQTYWQDSDNVLETGWGTCIEDSDKLNIRGTSSKKRQPVPYSGVEQYPFGSSGSWIFPDEARHFCITTASKQVMDLVGGCGIYAETDQREMSLSRTEAVNEQNMHGDPCIEVNKNEKTSHNLRTSKLESSVNGRVSGGLAVQAVRVAILVAFGTVVLVTRQRKSRSQHRYGCT